MKKGQALIEFIIILPILLLLMFGVSDYIRIALLKSDISSLLTDTKELFKEGKTIKEIEEFINENIDASLEITNTNNDYITLTITKKIEFLTPGLGKILGSPYEVSASRSFYE